MERYRNDSDVQELLADERDLTIAEVVKNARLNKELADRLEQMNGLMARLKEVHATNKSLARTLDEQHVLCTEQGKRLEIQQQQLETEAGLRRKLSAENKRLQAMVDERNGRRKSGGKVGRPGKHPAPLTVEENSNPQKQAADEMEVDSS